VGAEMLSGKSEKELAFQLGKCMTYFLPMHVLAGIYSQAELKTLFLAAMRLALPGEEVSGDENVSAVAEELEQRISAGQRDALAEKMRTLQSEQLNLNSWINNIELSANHAGLLMCNDFEVAMKALRADTLSMGSLPPKDKAQDLVLYAIGDRYASLRRQLGVAIG